MLRRVSFLIFVLVFCSVDAASENQGPAKSVPAPNPPLVAPLTAGAPKAPALKVLKVSLPSKLATTVSGTEKQIAAPITASLGDSIVLSTSPELGDYLDYAIQQKRPVTLFLDGNDTGIAPEALNREAATLQFHLERNGDNTRTWAALLRNPFQHQTRPVEASVGLMGGAVVPADGPATFTLVVVHWAWYAWAWLFLLVVLLVIFAWLVLKRDILRDGPKPNPSSLGRSQMAWWFFLILISYVMIWLISGNQDTITGSVLALMGISASTALGAVLIDSAGGSGRLSQAAADRVALEAAKQNARQAMDMAQATASAAPADPVAQKNLADAQAACAVVNAKLLVVNNTINGLAVVPQTRGFFRDILSDSNGTAGLHRLQIFVWTIVLGIIFLVSVVTELSMPEFSATLLATMGISAGTYLGFKFPEK
jgi:hypothetical protein